MPLLGAYQYNEVPEIRNPPGGACPGSNRFKHMKLCSTMILAGFTLSYLAFGFAGSSIEIFFNVFSFFLKYTIYSAVK